MDTPYLSQSELARKLNLPDSAVNTAVKTGRLKPDFIVGRTKAFAAVRVPEILQTLSVQTTSN